MYTVTDLGTLGGPTSDANAISENGIIVVAPKCPAWELSVRLPGERTHAKSRPPRSGERSHGERRSVNSQGQVVGQADAAVTAPDGGTRFTIVAAARSLTLPLAASRAWRGASIKTRRSWGACKPPRPRMMACFGPSAAPPSIWDRRFSRRNQMSQGVMVGLATQTQHAAFTPLVGVPYRSWHVWRP